MKGELAMGFARADPRVEARADALLERLVVPHPDEQVVGWVPLQRTETCECRHGADVVAIVEVRIGRGTTNPARVCEATLARIRSIFPADELIVREGVAA